MTATTAVSQAVDGSEGQLLTALQEIHGTWLQEAQRLLDSARRPEAGIHCRWSAIHYLTTTLSHRFELERAVVESLGQFEKAMVHWCRAVEDALGGLSWGEIPEQARRRFALLGTEEVHHDV